MITSDRCMNGNFGWWTDEEDWPEKRDLTMFKKWFDVEFHSVVIDLVDDVLVSEEG